jgi:Laminin N-terminal (Domain VI).
MTRKFCIFLLFFLSVVPCASSEQATIAKGFDAFLYRPVTANTTCGSPPEQYYNTKEGYVAPRSRVLSVCDALNPSLARPPSYMTDGNISSSWQSTNNQDKAYVTINLEQVCFLFFFSEFIVMYMIFREQLEPSRTHFDFMNVRDKRSV